MFGTITEALKGGRYHTARRCTGAAFMTTPIAGFIFYFFNFAYSDKMYLATAVNLSAYYATAILLAIAFLSIIGHKSDRLNWRYTLLASSYFLYLIPVWWPIISKQEDHIYQGHIVANALLISSIASMLIYGRIVYKRALKRIDNYYSENIKSNINWIARSIYLFIGLGVIAVISPFANHYSIWLCLIYLLYQFGVYIYVYGSMKRFEITTFSLRLDKDKGDKEAIPALPVKPVNISEETRQIIRNGLDEWIKSEGYIKQGITVKSVATEIGSNRTYLSNYINATYKCSFKIWITKLRIDQAKKILCDNEERSTSQIAKMVGFSSTSSFIHTFKNSEGTPPIKWREGQKRFKQINAE